MGSVELDRPYFYGVPWGQGFCPLDAALAVAAGRQQFDLQQGATRLTAEVPDETAQELFAELRGVELSTARLQELTTAVGQGLEVLDVAPPVRRVRPQLPRWQRAGAGAPS